MEFVSCELKRDADLRIECVLLDGLMHVCMYVWGWGGEDGGGWGSVGIRRGRKERA